MDEVEIRRRADQQTDGVERPSTDGGRRIAPGVREVEGHGAAVDGHLAQRLGWWRDAGIITDDQVQRILEQESVWAASPAVSPAVSAREPRRLSAIVEGLGYIGGILTLVGVVLLISRYWDDMGAPARLGLGAGSAIVLLIGGLLIPETEPALVRLRWALWTLSTVAAAVTVGITLTDAVDDVGGSTVALAVAGVVAVENGLLWAGRRRPVQQALFLAALPVITGAATSVVSGDEPSRPVVGLVVAFTGVLILVAGITGRTVFPALTDAVGAAAMVVGAATTIDRWQGPGYIAALIVVAALLALALAPRPVRHSDQRVVLAVVALMGAWQIVPITIVHFARQAGMATGLVVAVVGVAVLEAGRRRRVAVPLLVTFVGGAGLVGGLAITGSQSVAFATVAGLVAAFALLAIGTRPGWAIMSVFGAVGLLVNVPWAIAWFFPGEGRAPLLIAVAGVLIIGAAVLLAGMRGRIRHEFDQGGAVSRT